MATEKATFGAGCFWGIEDAYRQIDGVLHTAVGFMGGNTENPTYKEVCTKTTGHAEVVHLEFDPNIVSFEKLLEVFWSVHDPTTLNRQGPDVGSQYRSAIYYHSAEQEAAACESKTQLEAASRFPNPIVTEISPATEFYIAEDYHQQYFEKNGLGSCRTH